MPAETEINPAELETGGGKMPNDMPRWMAWTITRIDAFSRLTGRAVCWILVPLCVAMVYEVIARKYFLAPTMWALVRHFSRRKPTNRLAVVAGRAVGILLKRRGAAVGSKRPLRRHDAIHGHPTHRTHPHHRIPANRAVAAGVFIREIAA